MLEDIARLDAGEPLAYVIGWVPFLGLRIRLDERPLIPRPETEWWTEKLIDDLRTRFSVRPFTLLDLCAGSGAIGLAVLAKLPDARVTFAELDPALEPLIRRNAKDNSILESRFDLCVGELFDALPAGARYDVIATNPPYVPEGRVLDRSVTDYEPSLALYAGADGLDLIRRIASGARARLVPGGALWLECDSEHAEEARELLRASGAQAAVCTDQYGRARYLVSYWSDG